MHLVPWLVEKLELAAAQAIVDPALCGVVLEREAVQKGDAVLWKGKGVLRERVNDTGVDGECVGEEEGKQRPEGGVQGNGVHRTRDTLICDGARDTASCLRRLTLCGVP